MSKQNVPALRLEGFSGEWEVSPLSEISELNPSASVPAHFEYVDLASVLGTEMISHQSTSSSEAPSRAQRVARYGDIFYQTVRPYQKNNYHFMIDSDCDFVFSTGYAQIRPLIDGEFLFTAVQREDFLVQVLDRCTGTGYPAIAPNALGKIQLSYPPTLEEQQAIGAIFTNLDAAINQHTKKHQALQQAKTALMQRMFPQEGQTVPELRLDGFDGEWAMVRLGSIADMYQPHTISGEELQPSGIPVFGANGFIGFYHSANHQNDQITISARGEKTGTPSYVPGPSWITGNSMVVNVDYADIDKRFLYADLGAMSLKKFVTGGAQPQLTREVLNEVEAPTPPTLEEQQAIGAVFTQLDTLITTEAKYIESLKQAKTALLQRMFI